MTYRKLILLLFLLFTSNITLLAQKLKAGFDKNEFLELLYIYSTQLDTAFTRNIPKSELYKINYRSAVMGLDNRWDLYLRKDSVAVISIRGTTANTISWLENFYSAMLPAAGELKLSNDFKFHYKLANNPKAAVHAGWLIATAYLSRDILPKIDSCYKAGIKDFIILGHSQGGAISFLITSYVRNLQQAGSIPKDIRFKTYCSAAPKPGNLHYAYEYEAMTQNGWAFNIVNAADWVPETPMSIQTINDFNTTNPFKNARKAIRKQKFPQNIAGNFIFNQLDKPTQKAQRRHQRYLGNTVAKIVKKNLPGLEIREHYQSSNYSRTGNHVTLLPDEAYYKLFPDSETKVFVHHFLQAYIYLTKKLNE